VSDLVRGLAVRVRPPVINVSPHIQRTYAGTAAGGSSGIPAVCVSSKHRFATR